MRRLLIGAIAALSITLVGTPVVQAVPVAHAEPTTAEDALSDNHHLIVQNYGPVICMNFKLEPTLGTLVGYRKRIQFGNPGGFSQAEAADMVMESITKWCPEEIGRVNGVLGVGGLQ